MSLLSTTQAPEQLNWPGGQVAVQAPLTQVWPLAHSLKQAPQLKALAARSTQARAHWVSGARHEVTQAPPTHTSLGWQALSQLPQWLESLVRSRQLPWQLGPAGQAWVQAPSAQALPSLQTVPTAPQLLEPLRTETQPVVGPSLE